MIDKHLLRAILSAYQLQEPAAIEQVHSGSNRVYRLNFAADSDQSPLAVKICQKRDAHNIASKHAQAIILDLLQPRFYALPQTLEPANQAPQTVRHSWGLQWRDELLITAHPWLPHTPYRGLTQQLEQAGMALTQLQQAFASIDKTAIPAACKQATQQRLRVQGERLKLDDNFQLSPFRGFITRHAGDSKPCKLLNKHIAFLETELDTLHSVFSGDTPLLDSQYLSLVHLELSPSNFGFNPDHTVAVVFDFESLSIGHPLQDVAWLAATFCIDDRKPVTQIITDLRLVFSAMRSHLNSFSGWQDVILPFIRLGYLDAIFRKLQHAQAGLDSRLGFVREDILCLRWLRQYNDQLTTELAQI